MQYYNETVIIRAAHNRRNQFTQLCNQTIRDPNLTFEALGLLTYALSQSDNWTIVPRQIWKTRKISRNKIYALYNELIEAGYLHRFIHRERLKNGRWGRQVTVCHFHEVPLTQKDRDQAEREFKKFYRLPENRDPENGDNKNTRCIRRKESKPKKDKQGGKPPDPHGGKPPNPLSSSPPPKKIERAPQVFTTDEEHQKLLETPTMNEEELKKAYEVLAQWKKENPTQAKKPHSDFGRMKKWAIRAYFKHLEDQAEEKRLIEKRRKMEETQNAEPTHNYSQTNQEWWKEMKERYPEELQSIEEKIWGINLGNLGTVLWDFEHQHFKQYLFEFLQNLGVKINESG